MNLPNTFLALRKWVAINFLFSLVLYAGYIGFCLFKGINIDQLWGVAEHHRGPPSWGIIAIMEIQLLIIFLVGYFSDEFQTLRGRSAYILWGTLILVFLSARRPLIIYLGCSDIGYGFLGGQDS